MAEHVVTDKTTNFSVRLYAYDKEIQRLFSYMQFGIICEKTVRQISKLEYDSAPRVRKMGKDELSKKWNEIWCLLSQLINHLKKSPVFYPGREFTESVYKEFFSDENTTVYIAEEDNKIVGLIEANRENYDLAFMDNSSVNGTAYAGKSTMVKMLAKKYNAIACEENYHDSMIENLDKEEFPNLTYTRDLENWSDFVRRTPEEYEAWVNGCAKECTILELKMLEELSKQNKMIFVDTNIEIDTLKKITDKDHVLIMLAEPETSVNRFFERPDKEKQFLYQLLLKEEDPEKAIANFRECLRRINSKENYERFLNSGFHVMIRDEKRTVEESCKMAEKFLNLK